LRGSGLPSLTQSIAKHRDDGGGFDRAAVCSYDRTRARSRTRDALLGKARAQTYSASLRRDKKKKKSHVRRVLLADALVCRRLRATAALNESELERNDEAWTYMKWRPAAVNLGTEGSPADRRTAATIRGLAREVRRVEAAHRATADRYYLASCSSEAEGWLRTASPGRTERMPLPPSSPILKRSRTSALRRIRRERQASKIARHEQYIAKGRPLPLTSVVSTSPFSTTTIHCSRGARYAEKSDTSVRERAKDILARLAEACILVSDGSSVEKPFITVP